MVARCACPQKPFPFWRTLSQIVRQSEVSSASAGKSAVARSSPNEMALETVVGVSE